MANTIKCPHCNKDFEISQAFEHQISEQKIAQVKARLEEESLKRVGSLTKQIEELLDEKRDLKAKAEDMEIEMKRKLIEEEDKIRLQAKIKFEEEHQLKDMEKEKKLSDALSQIEVLKTKMQQGSQQTQGESMELELEQKLKLEFPMDEISEVKKGVRGADLIQNVVDKLGRACGTILWESKNAKWTDSWIAKLKEDGRQAKADLLVLVSNQLPTGVQNFVYMDGVWVCDIKNYLPLAWSLRFNLVSLYHERQASEGKDEKMRLLYNYLSGTEFKNRVEGIVEAFSSMQEELEKEKRFFNTKWARQEKEIRKVIDHTHGMMGDLQGITQLKNLDLMELDSGD